MSRFIDMTGWVMKEHGIKDSRWTVIEQSKDVVQPNGKHIKMWNCICALEALGSKTGHIIFGANATIMGKYLADLYSDFSEPCAISAFEHDCLAYIAKRECSSPDMFVGKTIEGLKRWREENKEKTKESNETCSPCPCIWMFVNNLTGHKR